jgi:uncharacterized protein YecE (DUF72 family)
LIIIIKEEEKNNKLLLLNFASSNILKSKKLSSIKIGTSGYTYSWNKAKPTPFQWYINQGFNSVEINASYYRFPTESWINTWLSTAPDYFTFSIKVNRSITDYTGLKGERALQLWNKFRSTLDRISDSIDFWLFKMPPKFKYTSENIEIVSKFFNKIKLDNNNIKAVLEFRDPSWWNVIDKIAEIGIVFCSVDAPGLPRTRIVTNNAIYLRIHGYKKWYSYIYSQAELDTMMSSIKKLNADKKAMYLNNNHGMLENGLYLLKKL